MVVNDIGQMVGWHTVCFEKHLIVHVIGVYTHPTADSIFKTNFVVARQFYAHNVWLTSSNFCINLFFWKGQRVLHVAASDVVVLPVCSACILRHLAHSVQFFRRVKCNVRLVVCQQLVNILTVHRFAFTLAVRTVPPVFAANTLIWAYATPGQSLNDVLLSTRHKSCLVGVFDTQ
ncbi:MAG: Uncharacterised protein [Cryomorphaceae bacterium]|nr:MAG: Uncharacterised protein [Cryomorphaceae bacterium]